ncbi:cilia- and flagella-associated protein 69-like [Bombus pascuorum]|uniref:cilia- and flagella-associated protein 69-like n=1 Tax=Bombus pascuorum TaxID=65598 RepID=UPI00298DEFFD|nr:cilia- and flagella-associated protein 69-like [Bombus pascuorum]
MEENKTAVHDLNKLEVNDVWKEFNCPKYVTHLCPKTDKLSKEILDFYEQLKLDTNCILQKLDKLISDPITSDSIVRICRLLYDYLDKVGDDGYKVKDLPLVIKVLKFLGENVKTVKEYELHLDRMLELCNVPPILEKPSESVIHIDIMEQYFTLLGHLLVVLPTKQQTLKIHRALDSLLLKKQVRNVPTIKVEHCRKAMENSRLPLTVTELLQASLLRMYPKILELVFLLSSISHKCCYRMLEANILNVIFIRMDLPYAIQLQCTRPPDLLLDGEEYSDEVNLLIMNTLWSLMKSITFSNNMPTNLKENLKPTHCVLWGLCYAFKRQIYYSQYRKFSAKIRNEIAMIILIISITLPSWNLVSSGIADAVIKYLIGIEFGSTTIFSKVIKFGRTTDDLHFEKTLLLIVTHLAEVDACIFLMIKRKLMQTVLQIVNRDDIEGTKVTWNTSQFWDLWNHAVNALSILAPKMPEQFIEYGGGIRLCVMLEWCLNKKFDIEIVMNCIKTICIIILSNNKYLLACFREYGIISSLIKLIQYILKFEKLKVKEQKVLTLALVSVERLMRKQKFYHDIYGEYSITFIMELLFRCIYQKGSEFQLDQRLLLAIGSYIWECIIWSPKNLEKFIGYGGVYIILDVIEIVPYCSRCLFLAVFTDMCDNFFCGPFLCTWRATDKRTGLMSLLAKIWREEEIRIEVKRNVDDVELPQMSKKQWLNTYCIKLARDNSPAIIDMIGSVRSKIFSICKIIERDNEKYEMAKEHYKKLHANLSMEDRITISTIELYFTLKLGQVWIEVAKYFEQVGITPLGMDGQALFLMTQRYLLWGKMTKDRQSRIIQSIKKEEDIEEKDEYARIRNSKLILALDAFDEIDYMYRTTDRSYRIKKKYDQIQQINLALKFPSISGDSHCHRTFQDKLMVTAIFNQHQTVSSGLTTDPCLSQMKLGKILPISPYDSYISDITYDTELLPSSLSSTCLSNIEKFLENE